MNKAEVLAHNLCCHGYGDSKEEILRILNKLTEHEIDSLAYNMYRTSEKCGAEAFDCDHIFKW